MYYLWFNETQSGPYTLNQIQAMWNSRQVDGETHYWQEGMTDWLPLSEIAPKITAKQTAPIVAKTAVIPSLQMGRPRKTPPTAEEAAALAAAEPEPEPVHEEKILWRGHPTLWKWAGLLVVGGILAAGVLAIFLYVNGLSGYFALGCVSAPFPLLLIIFYIYVNRNSTVYTVSNKRISIERGIFTKSSRELRVQDLRSIAAEVNILGYGDIEFSSSASDEAEVVFHAVPGATKVRDLVKQAQN